jgi:cobalt-zinc-cadmium efflux system outer membrane protein
VRAAIVAPRATGAGVAGLVCAISVGALAAGPPGGLTLDDAVHVALERNRDVIAARLEIQAAQLDVVAARLYPNPTLSYSVGNLVLGKGNSQGGAVRPGFADELVHSVGVSDVIDVWAKRSARIHAADLGVDHRRLEIEDALREIVYAVRSAFADLAREQNELRLAREIAGRYGETVRLSQARFRAGDISEAELRRVELEGLRYTNAVIDAELQLDLARQKLSGLMGLPSAADLAPEVVEVGEPRRAYSIDQLVTRALEQRPDVRAAGSARRAAEAQLSAAKREAYPDITVGAGYTHSQFTIAGDNPDTLGLSLSLPLPVFDRNQANIGRSALDIRRADNTLDRLQLVVRHEIAEAVRKADRSRTLLDVFDAGGGAAPGGMLQRAETSLQVAEKSYKAGAISLLELLDAQRTYLDVRGQYLRAVYDYRQATIDVRHALGE